MASLSELLVEIDAMRRDVFGDQSQPQAATPAEDKAEFVATDVNPAVTIVGSATLSPSQIIIYNYSAAAGGSGGSSANGSIITGAAGGGSSGASGSTSTTANPSLIITSTSTGGHLQAQAAQSTQKLDRRYGKISYDRGVLDHSPGMVRLLWQHAIPMKVEYDYASLKFEATVYSDQFDLLNVGEDIPEYEVFFHTGAVTPYLTFKRRP